jgi:asparagine synthase (glutamine-hydrolysing)
MSGIAGLYYLDGRPVSRPELKRMTEAISHRGQSGSEIGIKGPVGLGQINLEATSPALLDDMSRADPKGRPGITADVRLDNRNELIAGLGLQSAALSDAEIILCAYEEWGTECPKYLLGDFAFAVWDGRRRILFCARDHIGVRPFYYYASPEMFAFASEIKALLRLENVPRQLNEVRVADYLVPLLDDKAITFFQDIVRLPPAHCVVVSRDGLKFERYWSLESVSDIRLSSEEDYADAYCRLFTEAVRCRLGEGAQTGTFLSGGLDSSSITCVARNLLAAKGVTPLPTFSAVFPDVPQCDEGPYIQAVHEQGGCAPRFVRADQISPLESIEDVMLRQDEPFYAPNLFIHQAIYRKASEIGVRVLLDGIDGDTTVSHGLSYMAEQARTGRWGALASNIRGLARNFERPALSIARKYVFSPLVPTSVRRGWRWLRRCGDQVTSMNPTIRAGFARGISLQERCATLEPGWLNPLQTERQHHYHRLTNGILPFVLELLDRSGTMCSIEARYPFFDKRLIEYCYALPPEQKLHEGWTRMIARRAMEGILPDQVRWRGKKSNLSANFNRGLLQFERTTMDRVVLKDPSTIEGYVDIDELRRVYARFQVSQAHGDAMTIWKALTLALWLEYAWAPSEAVAH